jgi:hypothetical protein
MLTVPTAPVATAGNAITGASFTANWNSVAGATGYFVDVYANTAIIDDFTDGNFTANPVWVGNTSDFSILTNSTLPSGNASTDGSFLGTNASSGKVTLMTASTENTEWKFSLGSPDFDPSSSNYFGIILMSSTSFSGDISASFNGYYLKIGVDGSSDYIELWKSNAAAKTKIGNFTSAGNFGSGALKNGLNMRITRDNSGVFQLFYSTGFTYPSDPTTNGGTLTDNTFSTSSYFGVYQYITSTSTSRRVYFDNMQLGSMSFVTGYENIYTTGTSLSVTGLTPSTTYYYVVRADNGSCTSANSNEISVTTNSCSGAAHIVSSILPTTGPVGTTVILKGSGFTAVTDVEIGGIVITDYTVSDNNTIVLRIPDGATTGTIDVFNNGCPKSSGTFTVLNSNGACGGGATATVTDLMISEVYDSETGSRGYIELFNGTSASINLSNYKIKINTGAITWVSLSGTLPPNQFAVVKIGNTGTSCDASITGTGALIINRSTSSGYNKNDDIELYKGATKIDRMVTPNELGYNMERNTLTNAPSTTFTSGNWTKTSTEACSSLGNPSFTVAPLLVINTHPTDWTSCPGTVQFSVAATATPSPVTSYAWYYNDLQSMTGWQLVSGNISGASGTNTATLSLPADFAPLYNYQFYCNVVKTNGGNTCTKTTNAAVFKYPTARYYRTKTSTTNGNWATAAQWEMSNDINFVSPAPITACAYPIAVNSSAVFVQSGTKTTLGTGSGDNFDIEIDKITIDGTLEINIDSKLTVNDSTVGADMLVNGILIDRGNSTNGIDFRGTSYTNGSGWILGNAGTVIKTSTSSVVNYRDFYQGGISNIPDGSSGAQWIYRYNGDGNPSTNAVGMFYPNLYFENANAGNFAFNNNLMALIGGSGGFCTVKGNLYIGTTGVGTVTAYNNNINPQAMKVLGNMTIGSGSTFTNLSYDNTVVANTHGHGTGIELYGNLTNNGTLTNNGGNSGILRFKGSGTQTVSGSGTFNLWNVELDKPSQTIVDQLVNLTTQNNLNFVHGILKTNSNVFTVSNGDKTNAVTGYDAPNNTGTYSDDKYVFGKLERAINTTGIYDFPVGDAVAGKAYNPIQLEISSGAGNATAQFIPADMSTHTCVAGPTFFTCIGKSHFYHYTGMTGQGIWRMGSSTGTTFSYNVILHPNTKKQ